MGMGFCGAESLRNQRGDCENLVVGSVWCEPWEKETNHETYNEKLDRRRRYHRLATTEVERRGSFSPVKVFFPGCLSPTLFYFYFFCKNKQRFCWHVGRSFSHTWGMGHSRIQFFGDLIFRSWVTAPDPNNKGPPLTLCLEFQACFLYYFNSDWRINYLLQIVDLLGMLLCFKI